MLCFFFFFIYTVEPNPCTFRLLPLDVARLQKEKLVKSGSELLITEVEGGGTG